MFGLFPRNFYPLQDDEPGDAPTGGDTGASTPDGEGQQPQPEKVLTQSEVNALIAREKKKAAEAAKREAEEERKRAEMSEAERYKAEKEEAEKKALEAEAKALRAERKASLAGKVVDAEAALKLVEDSHLSEDGGVNVDALLKQYPWLAPSGGKSPAGGANPPSVNGKSAKLADLSRQLDKARSRQERIRIIGEINKLNRS